MKTKMRRSSVRVIAVTSASVEFSISIRNVTGRLVVAHDDVVRLPDVDPVRLARRRSNVRSTRALS